jgi:translation initiation factor 4B
VKTWFQSLLSKSNLCRDNEGERVGRERGGRGGGRGGGRDGGGGGRGERRSFDRDRPPANEPSDAPPPEGRKKLQLKPRSADADAVAAASAASSGGAVSKFNPADPWLESGSWFQPLRLSSKRNRFQGLLSHSTCTLHSGKPNPFGGARPVDTAAKIAEAEKKMQEEKEKASAKAGLLTAVEYS